MTLHVAPGLDLPVDFVTKTTGILAQRRKGKTYTAKVIAEELVDNHLPFVVLDPTGAWWGLRSSADGTKDGLPVTIFGGQHGDAPLERTAGKLLAELVVEEPGYYILDLSLFESGEAERQLATDFAERLYRRKGQPGGDTPLHLFVDEADRFVPQRSPRGDQRMLGAFEALVRRGGIRGIGTTLISQRHAVVNKNVLEQLDMLIVLRTVGPNDRRAIEEYVKAHGSDEERRALMESLASLELGEAWIWEPGAEPALFERVRIREGRTFNSSATPKAGEAKVVPRRLASVDLDVIKERMSALIEKAAADDPKALRKRITELEREAKRLEAAKPEPIVEFIDIPLLDPELVQQVEMSVSELRALGEHFIERADVLVENLGAARVLHDAARGNYPPKGTPERTQQAAQSHRPRSTAPGPRTPSRPQPVEGDVHLKAGARRILEVLARHHPMAVTRAQVGTLTGFKITGGTFQTYWSLLKRAGYVDEGGDGLIRVTEQGLAVAGVEAADPLTTEELINTWRRALKAGARQMLDALVEIYPRSVSRDDLAAHVEMTATGGTFQTYLSTLRRNGLATIDADGVRADDALFLGGDR